MSEQSTGMTPGAKHYAGRLPPPTMRSILMWISVVMAEIIAGVYALHIYAHVL